VKRSEFLNLLGLGSVGFMIRGLFPGPGLLLNREKGREFKNWAWITTDLEIKDGEWQTKFATMRQAGIDAILPEIFKSRYAYYASRHLPVGGEWLERILPLAKNEGLEVHAWMWTMPCNIPQIQDDNPEWFCINGNGESSLVKPAYVDYYKFLCPNRIEVQDFIQKRVNELASYDDLDGIHLDYIRYPDVIIPEALQPKYNIIQDREYPEYDYCYCDVCRAKFKEKEGIDPLELEDPSQNEQWRQFRYDSITSLVNDKLVPIVKQHDKQVTAAVFPNWEMVRQQWMVWDLDAFLPMLYHNFYNGNMEWIKTHTRKFVSVLAGRAPLYSGLFVPALDPDELAQAVQASQDGGAEGIALFHANALDEKHWHKLRDIHSLAPID
jgi:uncharacterized lipoprotein YddW (UPF0748 family)